MGSGCLKQGNSGVDTKCSYNGEGPESGKSEKASHVLSNKEVIYHFSGNVAEWVRDSSDLPKSFYQYVSSYYKDEYLNNNLDYSPQGVYPLAIIGKISIVGWVTDR